MRTRRLARLAGPATLLGLLALLWGLDALWGGPGAPAGPDATDGPGDPAGLRAAVRARASDVPVEATGRVVHRLPDDEHGSRHQRFLVVFPGTDAILVAHNVDLAPRIDDLRTGDAVTVRGRFEWNEKGGVIHWTHHDPDGRRPGGFVRHGGRVYR